MAQLPNISELVVCYFALSKLGAIISPVPVQYGSHELQSLAGALKPDAMISITRFRDQDLAAHAAEALGEVPVLAFGSELTLEADNVDRAATDALATHHHRVLDLGHYRHAQRRPAFPQHVDGHRAHLCQCR
jgi:acyl-coenzyme A synthetase/AMP-(fatty) acid ligase